MIGRRGRKKREHPEVDADAALRESLMELGGAVRKGAEARRLVDRLRAIQKNNHFGPSIANVYRGEKHP